MTDLSLDHVENGLAAELPGLYETHAIALVVAMQYAVCEVTRVRIVAF